MSEIEKFVNTRYRVLRYLIDNKDKNYEAFIVYFIPDLKKDGGKYCSISGVIKKVDVVNRFIKS